MRRRWLLDRRLEHLPLREWWTLAEVAAAWPAVARSLGLPDCLDPSEVEEVATAVAREPWELGDVRRILDALEGATRDRTPQWSVVVGASGLPALRPEPAGRLQNAREAASDFEWAHRVASDSYAIVTALAMRAEGASWNEVGTRLRLHPQTIRGLAGPIGPRRSQSRTKPLVPSDP